MPREYRALSDQVAERERREDARFGQVAALIANVNRDSKQRPVPYHPSDFFPSLPPPPTVRASDEEVTAAWEAWALSFKAP